MASLGLLTRGLGSATAVYSVKPSTMRRGLKDEMNLLGEELVGEVKRHIVGSRESNPEDVLGIGEGTLRGSIGKKVSSEGTNLVLRVGPQRIEYGRIHEFGGMAGRGRTTRIPKLTYLKPELKIMREHIVVRLGDRFITVISEA